MRTILHQAIFGSKTRSAPTIRISGRVAASALAPSSMTFVVGGRGIHPAACLCGANHTSARFLHQFRARHVRLLRSAVSAPLRRSYHHVNSTWGLSEDFHPVQI